MKIRQRSFFSGLLLVALVFPAANLWSGIVEDTLTKIRRSEFVFPITESNAPFIPLSWVNATYYTDSQVDLTTGELSFTVQAVSQALFAPVWVGKKDMVLVGEYGSWQKIKIEVPNPSEMKVTTFVPMVAWVRQFDPKTQGGLFVAPNFVNGGRYNGYDLKQSSVYAGAVAFRWSSDRFAWGGGVVGYREGGEALWLPYLGAVWRPKKEFSMALVMPWPSMTYAPSPHSMFQLGLAPAGATLGGSRDGQQLKIGFSSWNLMLSAHRQLTKSLWLSAGAGWSGFGSFSISGDGDSELEHKLDRGPVFSIQLALRPKTAPAVPR